MREYTIHPLVVGVNETDQGVMTYLRDYGKRIYLPIYAFYLKGGDRNILAEAYDSIQKIRRMADILIPIHDPAVGRKKCIPEP
jgi:hypothetical protein